VQRVLVFGNSGSGKTTYARKLVARRALSHLDLDILAWQPTTPPVRRPLAESEAEIKAFTGSHSEWVIEGSYADLLALVLPIATKVYFLNPGKDSCLENCKQRPWEPNKYDSKDAQDAALEFLLGWVGDYESRGDEFSLSAHRRLFDDFEGKKFELSSMADIRALK